VTFVTGRNLKSVGKFQTHLHALTDGNDATLSPTQLHMAANFRRNPIGEERTREGVVVNFLEAERAVVLDVILVFIIQIFFLTRVHRGAFVVSWHCDGTYIEQITVMNLTGGLEVAVVSLLLAPLFFGRDESEAAAERQIERRRKSILVLKLRLRLSPKPNGPSGAD
jgi:hypothetical protein